MPTSTEPALSIADAMKKYIDTVRSARSEHTARAYENALACFAAALVENWLDPASTPIAKLTEEVLSPFALHLKSYAPGTERLYLQAVKGFYEFVDSERLAAINVSRVRSLIRLRARRPGIRLPQFPADEIDRVLDGLGGGISLRSSDDPNDRLRAMRDRAFLLTLGDTGLRVHEACKLRRGDLDWNEGRALIVGKGNHQAVVRFSSRSMTAVREYLSLRSSLDGNSGRPLPSLPLFARHDKGAGKKVKFITPSTGRNIVSERVEELLGKDMVGRITPHSFRHYFVTTVLRGSGNLKLAQELARHRNIQVTQRYAHLSNDELDQGYYRIFEKRNLNKPVNGK
jgi:site-specific recombinase XerD